MSVLALTNQLAAETLPLDSLYLDPNNPRFVDSNWEVVDDANIGDEDIQERTTKRLIRDFSVEKLQMNMEINGYLPIDRVIVREFSENRYVVLEGNRRICAAKMISKYSRDGVEISKDVLQSVIEIPTLIFTGGDHRTAAWVFQGLRHISGIEDWSAFNKAKLLVEQMEAEGLSLTDAGKRFGLTAHGAGQWVRGYYAFKQAKEETDFVMEIDERSYPYFQELFSRSSAPVREWLEWNESEFKFGNQINFNEYVGWLYPRSNEDEEDAPTAKGDWEKRLIARRDDIRDIAILIRDDVELFEQFRVNGQLEQALSQHLAKKYEEEARKKSDPVRDAFISIERCTKALEEIPLKATKDPNLKSELLELISKLEDSISYIKE